MTTPNLDQIACDGATVTDSVSAVLAEQKAQYLVISETICEVAKRLIVQSDLGDKDSRDFAVKQDEAITESLRQLSAKVDGIKIPDTVDTADIIAQAKVLWKQDIADSLELTPEQLSLLQTFFKELDSAGNIKDLLTVIQDIAKMDKRIDAIEEAQKSALKIEDVACLVVATLQRVAADMASNINGFKAGTMQCIWGLNDRPNEGQSIAS